MRRSIRCAVTGIAALLLFVGCSSNGAGGGSPATYTVTYEANNADGGVAPSDVARYEEGAEVTILGNTGSLTRDEYPFFVGWNGEADGSGENCFIGETFAMPGGDVRLYALWLREEKVLATDGGVEDYFGTAVAIDGDYLIVGADERSDPGNRAYIFRRTGTGEWIQSVTLTDGNGVSDENFGGSVAISDGFALVGASWTENDTGAAYLYRRAATDTWTPVAVYTGAEDRDFFGGSVALNGDIALVGASGHTEGVDETGAVYIFRRDRGTTSGTMERSSLPPTVRTATRSEPALRPMIDTLSSAPP